MSRKNNELNIFVNYVEFDVTFWGSVFSYFIYNTNVFFYEQKMFLPSCHFQMVMVCSGSSPTERRSLPVALKLTEQTPFEW